MAIFPCPIPKMHEARKAEWHQPDHSEVRFTSDGYAVVTKAGLADLNRYDRTNPTGMYAGKMWKREFEGQMYLCWYDDYCEVKFRKILPQEAFDLLNPGGKDNL